MTVGRLMEELGKLNPYLPVVLPGNKAAGVVVFEGNHVEIKPTWIEERPRSDRRAPRAEDRP